MLLRWFDASQASAFGEDLARNYDMELRAIAGSSPSKREDKHRKLLGRVLHRVEEFGKSHRPNMFQKAKMSNRIKWTLKELGHNDELVDRLIKEVLLALA